MERETDLSRREVLKTAAIATGAILVGESLLAPAGARASDKLELPELPWPKDALKSVISAETIDYHYGKHHKGYFANLNDKFAKETAGKTLEQIVKESHGKNQGLFNNAAQAWNHTFYWHSLAPAEKKPKDDGKLAKLIHDFGGLDKVKTELKEAGKAQFGSGWAWLVLDGDKLAVEKTSNAETPLTGTKKPLLVLDVWEHAYYIDFRNDRATHLEKVLAHIIDWEFAEKNLG